MPDFRREAAIGGPVAGVDEAGRGPLAGPVIAAAVILSPHAAAMPELAALDDSKVLARPVRERCFAALLHAQRMGAVWLATGHADVAEIDRLNILQATMLAMRRAIAALPQSPAFALVDGNRLPELPCPGEPVIKGDAQVMSIAAASVVAKVFRDAVMAGLARQCPGYGWERNAGYGTPEHQRALAELGPSEHHRRSFAPIRELL